MQDKDFDEVFRGKLDNFEMQPSANVWEGIDRELNADRRRRLFMPFLSVAASIVVLVTAGVYFIPKVATVTVKNSNKGINVAIPKIDSVVSPAIKTKEPSALPKQSQGQLGTVTVKHSGPKQQISEKPAEPHANNNSNQQQPAQNTTSQQPVLAATVQKPQEAITAVALNTNTAPELKVPEVVAVAVTNKPEAPVIQQPIVANKALIAEKPKHKAHTLGGLLNLAIAKVDKRADKVIVFAENDDEESDVTAINLGIVKIKKEK